MNVKPLALMVSIAATGLAGMAVPAYANSAMPGWSGKPADPNDLTCFVPVNGAVQNVCGAPLDWDLPLPITNAGSHAVTVSYTGASTLICTLYGFTQFGVIFSQNAVGNGVFGQGTIVTTASFPNGGSLMIRCTMSQGARITNFNYNP